jgi:hypothetical protein
MVTFRFTYFDYTSSTVQIGVQRVSQSSIADFVKYPGSGWATVGGYHGAHA